ncbi:MAG TPA: hypothetical protein VKD71_15130, partial [Gemmataceae bacterium]|nr:hypothetical protein [Gemmataceae bacterium]
MASRPSRSLCAPAILAVAFLFVVSLLVSAVGCGRTENPPTVVEAEKPAVTVAVVEGRASLDQDANNEAEKTRVAKEDHPAADSPQVEGAGKFLAEMKEQFKGKAPRKAGSGALGAFGGGFGG